MKHRKLTLSIVTAAALAAFGAVNAHDANTDPNVSVDPTISVPSDSSISSSTSVDSITDEERLKGLDRADQVAGVHGEYGRDNAREHQDRN